MARLHDKWTATGRTYRHTDDATGQPTRQKAWSGNANQRNILHSGTGLYQPWIRNGDEIEHSGGSVVFESDRQRIILDGQEMPDSRIFVQLWNGAQWVDAPHGAPVRDFRGGDLKFETRLTFPNAPYQLTMRSISGAFRGSAMGLTFRSPTAERIRFIWRHRGLIGPVEERFSMGGPIQVNRLVGLRFRDVELGWRYREASRRNYRTQPVSANVFDLDILIGPFDVAADELLTVFPDTWGPNDPAAAADDGNETSTGGWDSTGWADNILYFSGTDFTGSGDPLHVGWSWVPDLDTATAAVSSIDSGTQIFLDKQGTDQNPTNFTGRLYCEDAANPAVWSASHDPSAASVTVESEDGLVTGSASSQTVGVINPVNELVVTDGNTYDADNRMNFAFIQQNRPAGGDWWGITDCFENSGANNAELTIVYTPAGAPILPIHARRENTLLRM